MRAKEDKSVLALSEEASVVVTGVYKQHVKEC